MHFGKILSPWEWVSDLTQFWKMKSCHILYLSFQQKMSHSLKAGLPSLKIYIRRGSHFRFIKSTSQVFLLILGFYFITDIVSFTTKNNHHTLLAFTHEHIYVDFSMHTQQICAWKQHYEFWLSMKVFQIWIFLFSKLFCNLIFSNYSK